jgi:hypothetical protein
MKSRNSFYTITGPLETDAKLLPVSKPTLALHRAGKSALGQTRKSVVEIVRSGLPLKADSRRTSRHVGFVPTPEVGCFIRSPLRRLQVGLPASSGQAPWPS